MSNEISNEMDVNVTKPVVIYGDAAEMAAANIQAGIKFSLLKTHLVAAFARIVTPPVSDEEKHDIRILLKPIDTEAEWVSIAELVDGVKNLMGMDKTGEENFKKDLESKANTLTSGGAIDKIHFKLATIFLNYQKTTYYNKEEPKKEIPEKTKSITEYAFSIEAKFDKDLFDPALSNIVSIDRAFFSIWNTTRKEILDRMRIFDFDEF